EELEYAFSKIANHKIKLVCAGRTDTGVHSIGQVVHFKTKAIRRNFSWIQGVNTYLSKNIAVKWIKQVPEYFNARHSAISRS
ncbi:MAG: tRNA pseudouridine(38-40) synthase TruA, partial [Buchnera aphidicola]|nr:tRNA pseudouridine(38-40) synthase TruA [Buchnera aphidicola]